MISDESDQSWSLCSATAYGVTERFAGRRPQGAALHPLKGISGEECKMARQKSGAG